MKSVIPLPTDTARPGRMPRRLVWAVVIVVGASLSAVFVGQAWRNWSRTLDDAGRQSANIAMLAERQVSDMVNVADIFLKAMTSVDPEEGEVAQSLAWAIDEIPSVVRIVILDPATGGMLRQSPADGGGNPRLDAIDMQAAATAPGAVRIGSPVRDTRGRWTVGLSRGYEMGGRPLVGVVHLDLGRFASAIEGVDVGARGSISIQTMDGIMLVRKPYDVSQVGRDISKARLYEEIRTNGSEGTFDAEASTDGQRRIFSYRVVPQMPLVVTVGLSHDEVLQPWFAQVAIDAGVTMALLGLLVSGGGMITRVMRRRESLEEARREGDAFVRGVLESSGDCILVLDTAGNLLFVNRGGLESLEAEGLTWLEGRPFPRLFADAAVRAKAAEALGEARAGRRADLTACLPTALGNPRTWDFVLTPIPDAHGGTERIVAAARDVTERMRIEDELRAAKRTAEMATQAKSDFLSSMSHEIRTPLNGILGITEILRAGCGDERDLELLRVQETAGRQLLGIVSNVIDWTRIEEGRLDIQSDPVDLRALCRDCIAIVSSAASDKDVRFESVDDGAVPHVVRGDALRIRQVLLNFLSNAVRHSPPGVVAVRLASPSGGRARLSVRDGGNGIPRERQHLLFLKFSQVGAGSDERSGSGLGLAIARRVAEAMGGRVGVESEAGAGATFWFEFPAVATEGTGEAPPTCLPAGGGRILVAEDAPVNRTVIRAMLEPEGYHVTFAMDGAEAVRAATQGGFGMILMDVRMPVMDGIEATRAIRGLPGPVGRIPIVALTANVDADEVAACLAAGMDAHLPKPLDRRLLLTEVASRVAAGPRPPRLSVVS